MTLDLPDYKQFLLDVNYVRQELKRLIDYTQDPTFNMMLLPELFRAFYAEYKQIVEKHAADRHTMKVQSLKQLQTSINAFRNRNFRLPQHMPQEGIVSFVIDTTFDFYDKDEHIHELAIGCLFCQHPWSFRTEYDSELPYLIVGYRFTCHPDDFLVFKITVQSLFF